jgi:hypothetical protein
MLAGAPIRISIVQIFVDEQWKTIETLFLDERQRADHCAAHMRSRPHIDIRVIDYVQLDPIADMMEKLYEYIEAAECAKLGAT